MIHIIKCNPARLRAQDDVFFGHRVAAPQRLSTTHRIQQPKIGNIFGKTNQSDEILQQIITIAEETNRGIDTTPGQLRELKACFSKLRDLTSKGESLRNLNPKSLDATWRLLWTTEKEILFILKYASIFGTQAGQVYQVIDLNSNRLQNCIEFPPEGAFVVDSYIDFDKDSKRCSFEFKGARLDLPGGKSIAFPPKGKGSFRTLALTSKYRIAEDSRGDFLIIERVGPPRTF